jgi:hypothetical protein
LAESCVVAAAAGVDFAEVDRTTGDTTGDGVTVAVGPGATTVLPSSLRDGAATAAPV